MRLDRVIEPAQTKWTAPILLATKMDVYLCFCVEYGTERCYGAGRLANTLHGRIYWLAQQKPQMFQR